VLKTGDTMRGILRMNNNKITNIREPTDNLEAAMNKYVDDKKIPVTASLATINDGMTTLKTDFTNQVQLFLNFRRNVNRTINEFFGSPPTVNISLIDINTKINDIINGIPDFVKKTNLIKIPHGRANNIVYAVISGSSTWTPQNNTLEYTAEVTGFYRLSVYGSEITAATSLSPSVYHNPLFVMLTKDIKETFTLISTEIPPRRYWWSLEFVAEKISN
jgi:hypothetical protein